MMLNNLSIRNKLISIILSVTIFSVIIGFSMFLIYEIQSTKKDLVNQTIMNARLISEYSIRPLMFDYPEEAKDVLAKLKSITYVEEGSIFDSAGKLFASYKGENHTIQSWYNNNEIAYRFNGNNLFLFYPINYQQEHYGTLHLHVTTQSIDNKIYNTFFLMIIIIIAIAIIAFFLSYKLQLIISNPILDLANITQTISEQADYTMRVKKHRNDEIGRLYDNFNRMLRRIHIHVQERDKAEQDLRENEERIKTLLKMTPDLIWIKDISGHYLACNPKFEQFIGQKEKDIIGKTAHELLPAEVADNFTKGDNEVIKTGKPTISEDEVVYADDGHYEIVEIIRSPLFNTKKEIVGIFGISRDITERRRDEILQKIIYNIGNAVSTTKDMDSFYELVHREISKLIDATNFYIGLYDQKTGVIQLPYVCDKKDKFDVIPVQKSCSSYVMEKGHSVILNENEIYKLRDEGKVNLFGSVSKLWVGVPLKMKDIVIGIIVLTNYEDENAYDEKDVALLEFISEQIAISIIQKKAEDALRQSEERLRLYVENAHDGIMINGDDNLIEYGNAELSNILGYSLDEIVGQNLAHFLDIDSKNLLDEALRKNGKPTDKQELTIIRKNSEHRKVEISSTIIKDSSGEIKIFSHLFDITERYLLQEQLNQSQKMEAIGQLAGGVAHDFNNLLTVIQGYVDLLLLQDEISERNRNKLIQIQSASSRAEALTRQLLAFSRKQMVQPKIIQINTIINDSFKLFTRLIGEDMKIELDLEDDLPSIMADPHQIEQILINLIVNARDAVRGREDENEKSIKIKTQHTYIDEHYSKKHSGVNHGFHVELVVSDSGKGMDKQTIDKIFEPFYTTKEQGKGTGLGLSTVYGIVKQNKATIDVYSEINKGSIFRIYWPVSAEEAEKFTLKTESIIKRGKEQILFVEDDNDVRDLGEESLLSLGYTVYSANNANNALEMIKNDKINPQLLITDIIMPGMSGEELSREIIKLLPNITVIYTSGYTNDHIVNEGFIDKEVNFLGKPYTISTLSKKIREVLGPDKGNKQKPGFII